ncbi:MAG: AraC family transcriptional regulator [Cyclobacteriaceae bacterium]
MQNLFEAANGNPLFRQFKVSDLLFTEYKCLEQASVFDIWSQYNYFVYVLSGKKQWNTRDREYMVYAHELIFVKKGANIIHKFFEEQFCALLIFVPDDFIKEMIKVRPEHLPERQEDSSESILPVPVDQTLKTYFQSLLAYFYQDQAPSVSLLEVKFKELLLNLLNSSKNQQLRAYFNSLLLTTKPSIRAIMETNFTYNLSLPEFARLCGRSLTVFKEDFKAIYQCSPGRWLTQKRLDYAKALLQTTDKNINELIFECGFENASHFTRVFKERFGATPLNFKS